MGYYNGSPFGLSNHGQFPDAGLLIIDDSMALTLKSKRDNFYIWCNADQFVQRHRLTGLNSGMFISEDMEAIYNDFENVDLELIGKASGSDHLSPEKIDHSWPELSACY